MDIAQYLKDAQSGHKGQYPHWSYGIQSIVAK